MHPAFSVIFFTTASGAGYGLLAWLGFGYGAGFLPPHAPLMATGVLVGFALVTAGLLSSTFHLGHPERAWRAFTQWRTSWLSREGVCAVAAYAPMLAFGAGWLVPGMNPVIVVFAGFLLAVIAVVTVFTTAMIYASLRAIPAWSNAWVPLNYVVLSVATGGVFVYALLAAFGLAAPAIASAVAALLLVAALAKIAYWRHIDATAGPTSASSAIGVTRASRIALTQSPHSGENYLQQEMGFRIARRHARKLRLIALTLGMAAPAVLGVVVLPLPAPLAGSVMAVAVLSMIAGVLTERWLFFAEARHTVSYYYQGASNLAR